MITVSEIFLSIEGEGIRSGIPSAFVRFAGCNLSCVWCDTPQSLTPSPTWQTLDEQEIQSTLLALKTRDIVITGGEPLIQLEGLEKLSELLKEDDKFISIETNGTIFSRNLSADLVTLSPKLPSAKQENAIKPDVLKKFLASYICELKLVIHDDEDIDAAMELVKNIDLNESVPIILQPNGAGIDIEGYRKRLANLIEQTVIKDNSHSRFFRSYHMRVLPQIQKIAWNSKPGR